MVCVGIDVAKDKHDCFILSSEGEVLEDVFTIQNTQEGFAHLLQKIRACTTKKDKIKVGLEATGHYSHNILEFLLDNGLPTYVINPLHTNLYRKSLSLRKTKTDRIDARTIATMLLSDVGLKPYTNTAYHNEELKSLTRYRADKIDERSQLKQSFSRLVCIAFPEVEKLFPRVNLATVYALFEEYPSANHVANAHLTRLTNLLQTASKGRYHKEKAIEVRDAARSSIGSTSSAKALEIRFTIRQIRALNEEIDAIEVEIKKMMESISTPIITIPGISVMTAAVIYAEIRDFSSFDSPDKILAFAGFSPSTYQSGQLTGSRSRMEKRGSRYLREALFHATRNACQFDPTYRAYLDKKRAEGKHYYVAISHAAKKLVRLIFAMEKSGQPYRVAT